MIYECKQWDRYSKKKVKVSNVEWEVKLYQESKKLKLIVIPKSEKVVGFFGTIQFTI